MELFQYTWKIGQVNKKLGPTTEQQGAKNTGEPNGNAFGQAWETRSRVTHAPYRGGAPVARPPR